MVRAFREIFRDAKIMIYSGPAPADPNDAVTGVYLGAITKASGTPTTRSLQNSWRAWVRQTGGKTGPHELHIRFDPAGVTGATGTIAYVAGTDPTSNTWSNTVVGIVREVNDSPLPFSAIREGTGPGQTGGIGIACDVPGDEINVRGGTSITGAVQCQNDSRGNWIFFNDAATGAVAKTSDVWSLTVSVSGVAGYFRIVTADDDGTHSHSQPRIQGSISTSGAEMNLANTSLVAGTTVTIDSASVTMPMEA